MGVLYIMLAVIGQLYFQGGLQVFKRFFGFVQLPVVGRKVAQSQRLIRQRLFTKQFSLVQELETNVEFLLFQKYHRDLVA
jgi:hypothetical protein